MKEHCWDVSLTNENTLYAAILRFVFVCCKDMYTCTNTHICVLRVYTCLNPPSFTTALYHFFHTHTCSEDMSTCICVLHVYTHFAPPSFTRALYLFLHMHVCRKEYTCMNTSMCVLRVFTRLSPLLIHNSTLPFLTHTRVYVHMCVSVGGWVQIGVGVCG